MSRSRLVDVWDEAVFGLAVKPLRTALTGLSIALGVGALVVTVGISRTAGNQIVDRFDALQATVVSVEAARPTAGDPTPMRWNVEDQLLRLHGVRAAGGYGRVRLGADLVRPVAVQDPRGGGEVSVPVLAVSPGLLAAADAEVVAGRFLDDVDDRLRQRVAVVGADIADELRVHELADAPAIFLGDDAYTVVGVVGDAWRFPALASAVLLPPAVAADRYALDGPTDVLVGTDLGAAQLVAGQAALALSPQDPDAVVVHAPPDPRSIRDGLRADVNGLFLVLGGLTLVVGAIGVANTTLVSIIERTGEIGLRRALGASRSDIASQILAETGLLGLAAGCTGTAIAVDVVVVVARAKGWTPTLDPWLALVAPVGSVVVTVVAGLSPALRATRITPVEALRSS